MSAGSRSLTPAAATARAAARSRPLQGRIGRAVLHVVLLGASFVFSLPLLWVVSTSLKSPREAFNFPITWIPTHVVWSNYPDALTRIPSGRFALNTAIITVSATGLTLVCASMVAYSLARLRWPGRDVVFSVVIATMILPQIVTLVPSFLLFKAIGWVDTFLPLIVPSATGGAAFYIFLLRQYLMGLPYELEEAARIDGASTWRIWWQIILPLSGPVLAAVAIFSALYHYNDFLWPLVMLSSTENFTLALGLRFFTGQYPQFWPLIMSLTAMMLLPVIVLFFFAQRHFIRGIHLSGLAGR